MKLTPEDVLGESPQAQKRAVKERQAQEPVPEEPMEEMGKDYEDDGDGKPKGGIGRKILMFLFMLAIVIGFCLFVVNVKGFVDSMRIDNVEQTEESGADVSDTLEESTENGTPGAGTDNGKAGADATASGQISSSEAETLRQEAHDAKSRAAILEQELKNAKALLDASTAREAQLRNELESSKAPTEGK